MMLEVQSMETVEAVEAETSAPKKRASRTKKSEPKPADSSLAFWAAVLKARTDMRGSYEKTGEGGKFSNVYGTLDDIYKTVQTPMLNNRLVDRFEEKLVELSPGAFDWYCVFTVIHVDSGYQYQTTKRLEIDPKGPMNPEQAKRSSITYSRRLMLEMFWGLCDKDDGDDGDKSGLDPSMNGQYQSDMAELRRLREENTNGRRENAELRQRVAKLMAEKPNAWDEPKPPTLDMVGKPTT